MCYCISPVSRPSKVPYLNTIKILPEAANKNLHVGNREVYKLLEALLYKFGPRHSGAHWWANRFNASVQDIATYHRGLEQNDIDDGTMLRKIQLSKVNATVTKNLNMTAQKLNPRSQVISSWTGQIRFAITFNLLGKIQSIVNEKWGRVLQPTSSTNMLAFSKIGLLSNTHTCKDGYFR